MRGVAGVRVRVPPPPVKEGKKMIDIKEMSWQELKQKIENIKAEREKTADALKRYEEELERRKQEVHLGVPFIAERGENFWYINPGTGVCFTTNNWTDTHQELERNLNMFHSQDSVYKHAEMLLAWRKALVANAKGEQIDIEAIRYLLPKGWICCTEYGYWLYSAEKPRFECGCIIDRWQFKGSYYQIDAFNIKPAEDWRESLMKCGL